MSKFITIVLDDTEPQSPLFVEIEDDQGRSIRIGNRYIKDGLTFIDISPSDISDHGGGS